jgi:von Willebrand factor type A domain
MKLNNVFKFLALLVVVSCSGVTGIEELKNNSNNSNNINNANNINNINNDAGGLDITTTDPDGMVGCDPKNFSLQASEPAEVYLVIDGSGSMLEPGATPGMTRWDELVAAMDTALTMFAGSIRFGVLIFPSDDTCATQGPLVSIALNNRDEILYHLNNTIPSGGTPTAAALRNAAASLSDFGTAGSPKFIILATDGGPNCNYTLDADPVCSCSSAADSNYCCTNFPGSCFFGYNCLDDANTINVISDMHSISGIDTFVIGLAGTDQYIGLLNSMAVAGGKPQIGGSSDYYPAESETELVNALNTIAVSVISCVIDLEEPPDFPDLVNVYMDGTEVNRDGIKADGWDYTDSSLTAIELYGPPCDLLRDGDQHSLTATFACIVD